MGKNGNVVKAVHAQDNACISGRAALKLAGTLAAVGAGLAVSCEPAFGKASGGGGGSFADRILHVSKMDGTDTGWTVVNPAGVSYDQPPGVNATFIPAPD